MDETLRELRRQALTGGPDDAARWVAALARRDGDPIRRLKKLTTKVARETRPFLLTSKRVRETVRAATRTSKTHVSWRASLRQKVPGVSRDDKFAQCPYVLAYQHAPLDLVVVAVGKALAYNPKPEQAWPELKGRTVAGWWDKLHAWAFEESDDDKVYLTREQAVAWASPKPKPKPPAPAPERFDEEKAAVARRARLLRPFPGGGQ